MRSLATRSLAPAVLLPLVACFGGSKDTGDTDTGATVACTDMAAASVMVSTVDPSGAPLAVNEVLYTVDGGAPQQAMCASSGAPPCADWIAGWEVSGTFELEAVYTTDATMDCCWFEDRQTASVTVPMTDDGCHVIGQQVVITLDPTRQVCLDTACE